MNTPVNPIPTGLRAAVLEYARRIRDALQDHIGLISGTSGLMPRTVYQTASLQEYDPHEFGNWSSPSLSKARNSEQPRSLTPPINELYLLDDWRNDDYTKPLLIVAPAGSGKSCLLEAFTLRMVEDLLDERRWSESLPLPPAVPVLISLAKMRETPIREYLSQSEIALTDRADAALNPELLQFLDSQQRLVLLMDGYDEIPAAHGSLARQLTRRRGRFLLTSRPGSGERLIVSDINRQKTLQELTEGQANQYVKQYFEVRGDHRLSKESVSHEFANAWKSHFGRLLRRPLYLKCWCDFVFDAAGIPNSRQYPHSLGELSELLYRETLRARGQFQSVSHDLHVNHELARQFANWFGKLGQYFAERGFHGESLSDLVAAGLLQGERHEVEFEGSMSDFVAVANKCGLLTRSNVTLKYYLPKLPLAEHLIGKSLADNAREHPRAPEILISKFRSWIWRPWLHDILDYTFDALWHSNGSVGHLWGSELLRWMTSVVEHNLTQESETKGERVQDDLVLPFALTAIRWQCLRGHSPYAELEKSAIAAIQSLNVYIDSGVSVSTVIRDVVRGDFLIRLFGNVFLDEYRRLTNDTALYAERYVDQKCFNTMADAAPTRPNNLGPQWSYELLDHVFDEIADARRSNGTASERKYYVFRDPGDRCGKSGRTDIVSELVEEYAKARGNLSEQDSWRSLLLFVARSFEYTPDHLSNWIDEYSNSSPDPEMQEGWRFVIETVSAHVVVDAPHEEDHAEKSLNKLSDFITLHCQPRSSVGFCVNNPFAALCNRRLPVSDDPCRASFEIKNRMDLILDEELVVLSPTIRSVFINAALGFVENSRLKGTLSREELRIPVAPPEIIAFTRQNIEKLLLDGEFAEARRDFEERLKRIEERAIPSRPSSENRIAAKADGDGSSVGPDREIIARAKPERPIIDLRGVRTGQFKLQCFYEIGYEYEKNKCGSLNQVVIAFQQRAKGPSENGLREDGKPWRMLPKGTRATRPQMSRYCKSAMKFFGRHFKQVDGYKDQVSDDGQVSLFVKGSTGDYEKLSELGLEAWKICQQDLIYYRLISEND